MPLNEYDEILAGNTPESNEYEALLADDQNNQKTALQASMYGATTAQPERQAKILELSKRTMLPPDVVDRQFDMVSRKDVLARTDYDALIEKTPATATWLSDPNNSKLAHDDIEGLQKLESTVKEHSALSEMYQSLSRSMRQAFNETPIGIGVNTAVKAAETVGLSEAIPSAESVKGALGAGLAQVNASIAEVPALAYDVAAIPQNLVVSAFGRPDLQVRSPEAIRKNPVAEFYRGQAKQFQAAVPELSQSVVTEAGKGNYAGAGRALALQFVQNSPNQAALLAAAMTGMPVAGLVGAGVSSAASENVQAQESGASPLAAASHAVAAGTMEAAFERMGTIGLLNHWENAIAKQYGKQVSKEIFKDFGKTLAYSFAGEGSEEALTSIGQDFSSYVTGVNPEGLTGLTKPENLAAMGVRSVDAFALGGVSGGTMTGPAAIGMGLARVDQMRQANLDREFYLALGATAEATKLRQRMPEKQRELIERITKDSPVENVYIPVEAAEVYFQKKGINPTAAMQELGVLKSYDEARETGEDIKIPLGTWVEQVGTEHYQGLADDVKLRPDAQSVNELKAEREQEAAAAEKQRAEMEQLTAEAQAEGATVTTEPLVDESARAIQDQMKNELLATGKFTSKDAEYSAMQMARFFRTQGLRTGVDPKELFSQYQAHVRAGQAPGSGGGQVYEQKSSKKNEEQRIARAGEMGFDTDQVWYHGTSGGDFEEFSQSNYPGIAAFFTKDESFAEKFANDPYYNQRGYVTEGNEQPKVYPVFLKTRKTFDYENREHVNQLLAMIDPKKLKQFLSKQPKINGRKMTIEHVEQQLRLGNFGYLEDPFFLNEIKAAGFDSTFVYENNRKNIAVFEANQVRSTSAKFDPSKAESANIYYQSAGRKWQTQISYPDSVKILSLDGPVPTVEESKALFRDRIQGTSVTNEMTGWNISFSAKGRKKAGQTLSSEGNRLSYSNIDRLMAGAVLQRSEEDRRGKDIGSEGLGKTHVFYAPFSANGTDYVVSIKVHETNEGEKFYDRFTLEKEKPAEALGASQSKSEQRPGSGSTINIGEFQADVNALQRQDPFFQDEQDGGQTRGSITFGADGRTTIDLFAQSNLSTFLHESSHLYLNVFADLAEMSDAPQQIKDDWATILKWLGVESRADIKTEHHEMWADTFEDYLATGKAPSKELRTAFARFKVWMLDIYKGLLKMGTPVAPEISAVMDRMLATDQEIAEAYGQPPAQPAFRERPPGWNEEKWERYLGAREEERLVAEEILLARMMSDYIRQKESWWKDKRAEIRARHEEEVHSRRLYRGLSILQNGVLPGGEALPEGTDKIKIAKESLIAKGYSQEFLNRLPRPPIYAAEGKPGMDLDVVAELLGFESGDLMLTEMANAPTAKALIEQLTDEEMTATYPDFYETMMQAKANGQAVPPEVQEALHNDKRSLRLRMELEGLAENHMPVMKDVIRSIARRVLPDKAVRAQAEGIIGRRKLQDLNPDSFRRAEAKAANEAGKALAKGEIDLAFEWKAKELLNHELFRAATEARKQMAKALERFRKISKADDKLAKTRDIDLVNTARAILATFGIGRTTKTASEFIEGIKRYEQDRDVYESVKAMVESATAKAGEYYNNYKEMPYADFKALADTVDAIWELSRTRNQIEIDGEKREKAEVTAELVETIQKHLGPEKTSGYTRSMGEWDKAKLSLMGTRSALRRVESWSQAMDGRDHLGAFTRYFVNPLLEATNKFRLSKQTQLEKFLAIIEPIKSGLHQKIIISSELGHEFKGKAELLGALLHTGNDSNLEKMLVGNGWAALPEGDSAVDRRQWDLFIERMIREGEITKADMDAIQAIWDLNEEMKPDAQRAYKEIYGHYFSEITANPVMTPWGSYRGGYVPVVYDPFRSTKAMKFEDMDALLANNNTFMFPTTGKGFTVKRVKHYGPVMTDLRMIPLHIDKVQRFIHIEPVARQIGRIVVGRGFSGELAKLDPTVAESMLLPWLQRAATQRVMDPAQGQEGRGADRFFRALRRRAGMNTMVLNVTNSLQNFTGLSLAALKVKPRYLTRALWTYVRAPRRTSADIAEKSDYMKTRLTNQLHEVEGNISDLILNPSKFEKLDRFASKHGYILQTITQNIMDTITWSGAYDQATAEGMSEKEAVRAANAAVRLTQGAMNPEDVSKFETGSSLKRAFTMFYSYFNMQANLLTTEFGSTIREMGLKKGAGRLVYLYMFGYMMPAVIAELIVKSMSGKGFDEDEDDEYIDDLMMLFFGSQGRTGLAMVPVVGPIIGAGISRWNDKPYDDRISTSPAISLIESAVGAPYTVYKAIADDASERRAIIDSLTLLGLLSGLPTKPLAKPLGYLSDVSEGNVEPTGPVDFARGLITGKGVQQ